MSKEKTPETKTPLAPVQAGQRGLELRSLADFEGWADYVLRSRLAPKGIDTKESIIVATQMGLELGLHPMQAIQNIAVINGRPTVWGDTMLAVCQGSGAFDHSAWKEYFEGDPGTDGRTAVCECRRVASDMIVRRTFSVGDAKRAKLWTKSGPWQDYPQRMLQLRARAFALRDAFAAELRGFQCTEEVRDYRAVETVGVSSVSIPGGLAETVAARKAASKAQDTPKPAETPKQEDRPVAPPQDGSDGQLIDVGGVATTDPEPRKG